MNPLTPAGGMRIPAECIIKIDGKEVKEFYPYLNEVNVEMSRKSATVATLKFNLIRDETGKWLVLDHGSPDTTLMRWRKIEIFASFAERKEEVMRGYIREVKPNMPADMSAASLTVVAQDESILLDRQHMRRNWVTTDENSMNDGDIVKTVAKDLQLQANAQKGLDNVSLNNNGTYIKFLRDRADANGYEFYFRKGTIHFHKPELEGKTQPAIMLYAGWSTNCLSFSVSDDGHKPDKVSVTQAKQKGAGAEDEQLFKSDLKALGKSPATSENMGLKPFVWQLEQANGATDVEIKARAQASANENAWKISADGELDGTLYGHVLLNFQTVYVDGAGDAYGGLYYVDRVTHRFTIDGYRQNFKLVRNAIGDQGNPALQNRLSSVLGG